MDDQLLDDLYGIEPQDQQDDDMIKAAQAELVEAVADEAGIDLAEMDDAELDKFASYVLSTRLMMCILTRASRRLTRWGVSWLTPTPTSK